MHAHTAFGRVMEECMQYLSGIIIVGGPSSDLEYVPAYKRGLRCLP